ncbi:MAG: D-alanyl-D-alanine carboxypeptidase family protein [Clostridia bacterium]
MRRGKIISIALVIITLLGAVPARADNVPVAKSAIPTIISESAVLMDADSGQVIYNKQMNKRQFPASITKIMTTYLGVEQGKLTDVMTVSEEAVELVARNASHIALTGGEKITLEDALYGAMLVSANDACNVIAEHISGTIPEFTKLMTKRAQEFGAKDTNFDNTNGLLDDKHYTTAFDMAEITRHALKSPKWREIFGTLQHNAPPNNKQKEVREFYNQHSMICSAKLRYPGIIGGKAGYTTAAKFTLVTAAERDGVTLIAVVMKSPRNNDKYKDTKALFDYGFDNFEKKTIATGDVKIENNGAEDKDGRKLDVTPGKGGVISFLAPRGVDSAAMRAECTLPKVIESDEVLAHVYNVAGAELGAFPIKIETAVAAVAEEPQKEGVSIWNAVLITIGVIITLFLALIVFLYIRKKLYLRRRAQRRSASQRRRR